jgi:sialate O-acetylesterase
MKKPFVLFTLLACAGLLRADVKLPAIFSADMVLEKSAKTPVWGWADPGETVAITLDGNTIRATAGADGRWRTAFDLSASTQGPFEMVVQGKNRIAIPNVVVGEVWLTSGQSNMEWGLHSTNGSKEEIAGSANPLLRQFHIKRTLSMEPLENCAGKWIAAGPLTSAGFSGVGYYFGKKLQNELGVPVGLINASWGGTPIEGWISIPGIDSVPDLRATREKLFDEIKTQPARRDQWAVDFKSWLKKTGREDRPTADVSAYAAPDAPLDDWTPLTKLGVHRATYEGSGMGAIWIRRTIDIPADRANKQFWIELGPVTGFESVYWNGELVRQVTPDNHPGAGFYRNGPDYAVPAKSARQGTNTLAVRLYAPETPAKFWSHVKMAGNTYAGEWLSKIEYTLPELTAAELASMPKQPAVLAETTKVASQLYNGTVSPVAGYGISGAVWYQGESNIDRAYQYRSTLPLLIADWRRIWGEGDFPFYICQLTNMNAKLPQPAESKWAELREAQAMALSVPNTGLAVLIDAGESKNIHPRDKQVVGERLGLVALAKTYGRDIEYSGPEYSGMKTEGSRVRLSFTHLGGGLFAKPLPDTFPEVAHENRFAPLVRNSPSSPLEGFALCGADRKWVWADAKIDGDTVVVWSDKVPAPVAVRYAWADNPTCNLYNAAGLPAGPFRTDDFPASTREARY